MLCRGGEVTEFSISTAQRGPIVKKLFLLPMVFVLAWAAPVQAQEETRTLKDRIKSVSNRMFVKSGRMELTVLPLTSISLNDAFYQKYGMGAGIAYHISEAFAIQALLTYTLEPLNVDTGNATYHGSKLSTDIPYAGKRNFLVGADFCWSPVYGKVSLAAEYVMHFDTYLMGGIGGIGGELKDSTNFGFAGSFGLGIRLFFNRTFALKLELKDYMVFNDKVSIKDLPAKSDVQHQLLFNLGLSIFFLEGSQED
jgi:outer membrane beta-barrel protein